MSSKTCSHWQSQDLCLSLGVTVCSCWLVMTWRHVLCKVHVFVFRNKTEVVLSGKTEILRVNYMFDFKLSFACYMFRNVCHCQIFHEPHMNHTSPHEHLTDISAFWLPLPHPSSDVSTSFYDFSLLSGLRRVSTFQDMWLPSYCMTCGGLNRAGFHRLIYLLERDSEV